MSLILPHSYQKRRSEKVDPKRFRGYGKHTTPKCGAEAFWFTRFGKAWFDMDSSEVYFEDGQIKLVNHPIEDYRCPNCGDRLRGETLRLVKIIQEDEAESIHRREHAKVAIGDVCELCGERKMP